MLNRIMKENVDTNKDIDQGGNSHHVPEQDYQSGSEQLRSNLQYFETSRTREQDCHSGPKQLTQPQYFERSRS